MRRIIVLVLTVVSLILLLSISGAWEQDDWGSASAVGSPGMFHSDIPLYFIPNEGQVNEKVKFYARTPRYTLWLTPTDMVFDSIRKDGAGGPKRAVTRIVFPGANPNPDIIALGNTRHQVNFLKGKDASQWKTGVKTSPAAMYKNLYPGIDLKVYGIERQIEYDWIVKPGGSVEDIRFRYRSAKAIRIDPAGDMHVETDFGALTHKRPVSYQYRRLPGAGQKVERVAVESRFIKTAKSTYGIRVGTYDKNLELIIDPVVVAHSGYLGGSGDDHAFAMAVDDAGRVYITGDTYSSDFPTDDAYQNSIGGGDFDAFVAKISISGKSLVYSTYLGGGANEAGQAIQVDAGGRAHVTGFTESSGFPVAGAYQSAYGGGSSDAFVTILSTSGSGLVYSTFLGGSGREIGFGLALDGSGNIYVGGRTDSTGFPTAGAYQAAYGGGTYDAFACKFSSSGSGLVYSTFLGGSRADAVYGVAVDAAGSAYVTGRTESLNFPVKNEYQTTIGGGTYDVFVTKLSSSGGGLIYSTYLGGNQDDSAWGIAVDAAGGAYVTGETTSSNFPTVNPYQSSSGGGKDAFVTKFTSAGSGLSYSTYLGGLETDAAAHIAVDGEGYAYVTGNTQSSDFPVRYAYQNSYRGNYDTFVTMLAMGGNQLGFSTYLGGGDLDVGRAVALDDNGDVYVAGYTDSADFPVMDAYQNQSAGGLDAFVTKLSTDEFGSLCNGVDNCNLTWTTGGGGHWFEQSDTYYYDGDAVRSGDIGHDQSTYLQTTVTGPGTLTFYWNVSSEYGDYLRFYIDGIEFNKIYGAWDTSWRHVTHTVDSGTHTFKWVYQKDGAYVYGQDCGWVDNVQYTQFGEIALNRTRLSFGAAGNTASQDQTFTISSANGGILNWTVEPDVDWLTCSPASGSGEGRVTVSVDTGGLSAGTYTGQIAVSDPSALNTPQYVSVTLSVYKNGKSAVPFGNYATPDDGAVISSSVPFTGWVLDDIGVEKVEIFRRENGAQVYIGDALFVEGARPDVEVAYPDYPDCYKAGWGYMMLTNFLPNSGNGTFIIDAVATDREGHTVTLGSKTVTVDNANAVQPFGAIDSPIPGGTASGGSYRNQGWALTPPPNTVPTDGSTINVLVDGVSLGNPTYNIYRPDIAELFPGYNNSNAAHAYLDFDTTGYDNGLHTIAWTVTDDAANTDGIGSRYFNIDNAGVRDQGSGVREKQNNVRYDIPDIVDIPLELSHPVQVKRGFSKHAASETVETDRYGVRRVTIPELGRLALCFGGEGVIEGLMKVGRRFADLPAGSTLDPETNTFYWMPGAGFAGEYSFVFLREAPGGDKAKIPVTINIIPKFQQ